MPGARTETLQLNIGPQHPSTHGVLYLKAQVDGEVVTRVEPQLGYLHRGIEKLSEARPYHQALLAMNRCDYITPSLNELAYVMAVERLAGIRVPERAEYIRVIFGELNRITSHEIWFGTFLNDLGAFFTPFMYVIRDRERLLELLEEASGSRMMPNYFRFGGVKEDVPEGWLTKVSEFLDYVEGTLPEYHDLLESEIFLYRTRGVGGLSAEKAIDLGVTGPLLRATGFDWDLRRDEPYSVYDRFEFSVITAEGGDLKAAYDVRMGEIEESIKILRQAIRGIPGGPVRARVPSRLTVPEGDCYARIESAKGELGVYLVGDGTEKPYRLKLRTPSFCNLRALQEMAAGARIADLIVLSGCMDIVMGDVDR